jgi:hypothetical protein
VWKSEIAGQGGETDSFSCPELLTKPFMWMLSLGRRRKKTNARGGIFTRMRWVSLGAK